MSYSREYISEALKSARERKGLSQRELGDLAGVPQSHISKIESGGVDLRLSSLIELARVLNLELTLVPKKSSAAVGAIIRSVEQDNQSSKALAKEFAKIQNNIARASEKLSPSKEIAQLNRQVKELSRLQLTMPHLDALQKINEHLAFKFEDPLASNKALKESITQITQLRNKLVHSVPAETSPRPAYTLEDEDSG